MNCLHFVSLPEGHQDYALLTELCVDNDAIILLGDALFPSNPCLQWTLSVYLWGRPKHAIQQQVAVTVSTKQVVQLVQQYPKNISWMGTPLAMPPT